VIGERRGQLGDLFRLQIDLPMGLGIALDSATHDVAFDVFPADSEREHFAQKRDNSIGPDRGARFRHLAVQGLDIGRTDRCDLGAAKGRQDPSPQHSLVVVQRRRALVRPGVLFEIAPEDPPGFVVRTEAQKAAWDNGFRLERRVESGGWLRYGSTTARGEIWIAGVPPRGPWLLSIDHPEVAAELATLSPSPLPGPRLATFAFDTLTALHAALDRVYKLGVSLPDAPLARFRAQTAALPQTTEVEALVIQRVGQDIFRAALMDYWGARCPITGITDPDLLRASHIVPWAECDDALRLDVHNGLLLSVLWDAAFDTGLISFTDDGTSLVSPELTTSARTALGIESAPRLLSLRDAHRANLSAHRTRHGCSGEVTARHRRGF
jgi:HNH endonuclease